MDIKDQFRKNIAAAREVLDGLAQLEEQIAQATDLIVDTLNNGGKLLMCGNGGSAADAMHFCLELVGRYKSARRALPALCLNSNGGDLTCIVNDYGYEDAFSRQVEAFGASGDLLIVFTSSGKSANVLKALYRARSMGMKRISFLGKDGGDAKGAADVEMIVPSMDTARIQEAHTLILHTICDRLELPLKAE